MTVMGIDDYTILVKQGGSVFKCHRCHVMKSKPTLSFADKPVQEGQPLPENSSNGKQLAKQTPIITRDVKMCRR